MGLFLFLCHPGEMGHFIIGAAIEFAAASHPSYICSKQYTYPS